MSLIQKPEPLVIAGKAIYTLTSYDPVEIEVTVPTVLEEEIDLALKTVLAGAEGGTMDLRDFDAQRREIVGEIKSAGARREDNIQTAVNKDMSCLEMHVRMALRVRRALARRQWAGRALLFGGVALFLTAGLLVANACGVPLRDAHGWRNGFLFGLQTLGALTLSGIAGYVLSGVLRYSLNRFLEQQIAGLDEFFAAEYNRELSLGTRDDLRRCWEQTHPVLAGLLRVRWRDLPLFAWGALRRLKRDAGYFR